MGVFQQLLFLQYDIHGDVMNIHLKDLTPVCPKIFHLSWYLVFDQVMIQRK